MFKPLAALLPLAMLSACISFGAKPPPTLLTLRTTAEVPVGQRQVAAAGAATTRSTLTLGGQPVGSVTNGPLVASNSITVSVPTATQEIATVRVPVQATPTSIAYLKNAAWVEPPARAFGRLLGDTLTARSGRVVLSSAQSFQTGASQLTGDLRAFGVDAASNSAVVVFDAALLRTSGGGIEKQRFEARVPVAAIDATNAGVGLNAAANQIAAQVADWVGR